MVKPKIKAIQTAYKGYHFRSRLEARYAVFFDALGLEWEYEPEGFDLGDGVYYLPDFLIKTIAGDVYVEVKGGLKNGSDLDVVDRLKILSLVEKMPLGCCVYILGDMPKEGFSHIFTRISKPNNQFVIFKAKMVYWFADYGITEDAGSGTWRVCNGFRDNIMEPTIHGVRRYADKKKTNGDYDLNITNYFVESKSEYSSVNNAYKAARSARFEHGQSGATL